MAELENIVGAVAEYLESCIGTAVCAYPVAKMPIRTSPIIAVGIEEGTALQTGFGEYLGIYTSAETGERELYGKRLEVTLSLFIYAPKYGQNGGAECQKVFGNIVKAMGDIPFSIKVRELRCGETGFDRNTGMFLCKCSAKCSCLMTGEKTEDGMFTDFILQGVIV